MSKSFFKISVFLLIFSGFLFLAKASLAQYAPTSTPVPACSSGQSCSGCSESCYLISGCGSCSFSHCVCYQDGTCNNYCTPNCPSNYRPGTGAGQCTVNCSSCGNNLTCVPRFMPEISPTPTGPIPTGPTLIPTEPPTEPPTTPVPTPACLVISGVVTDSTTGAGIPDVGVYVYNSARDTAEDTIIATTNTSGYWGVPCFVSNNNVYAVGITGTTAPSGYINPVKTTTAAYSCPPDIAVITGRTAYECQWANHSDCGTNCNFSYDPLIPKSVSLVAPPSVTEGQDIPVTVTGNLHRLLGTGQKVTLYLMRQDQGTITGFSAADDKGTITGFSAADCNGITCYKVDERGDPVVIGDINYVANIAGIPAGDYYIYVNSTPNPGMCTGNPFCSFNSSFGTLDCPNWVDCSNHDWQPVVVSPVVVAGENPWFQTTGGDIQAQSDITSPIPACATTSLYLSQNGQGGTSGVVGYGSSLNLGDKGGLSENSWQANTTHAGQTIGFEYLANRFDVDRTEDFAGVPIDISTLVSGVYYSAETPKTILGSPASGSKIVIFVDGTDTTTITSDLVVPEIGGGFLAIIAKGDLTFSPAVTEAQGFFLAGGTLRIDAGANQFNGEGSFVGLADFVFSRDLSDNCDPAENFVERPDFYINAPSSFKITGSFFKELGP